MKAIDKYKYWVMLSDYDLDTIQVLIDGKRWVYVAFICQQAIERQLKGMYVYHLQKEAPKGHNVSYLFEKIVSSENFGKKVAASLVKGQKEKWEDFMVDVMFYYMNDYPFSYKNIASRFIDETTARELYQNTKECVAWLRTLQPMPEKMQIDNLAASTEF
ncbi:MAG: HEPN domain-containing protein [Angelakisella sp.]|nr:HEPN domain-containing protein [Angelakisella sp.]